jgi:hypothetical protein
MERARKCSVTAATTGVIVEVIQMIFYRHRVTNQLKIIYQETQR